MYINISSYSEHVPFPFLISFSLPLCAFFAILLVLHCLHSCPPPTPPSSFLSSFFSFAFASLCRPFFLFLCYSSSFLPSSSCAHSKLPLNCCFLQYSAGLLFAGQSQVNCVCSFSICFCVSDRVNILK